MSDTISGAKPRGTAPSIISRKRVIAAVRALGLDPDIISEICIGAGTLEFVAYPYADGVDAGPEVRSTYRATQTVPRGVTPDPEDDTYRLSARSVSGP